MTVKIVIVAMLSSLGSMALAGTTDAEVLEAISDRIKPLFDKEVLKQKAQELNEFVNNPEGVGQLGLKSTRNIPIGGLELLEHTLTPVGENNFEGWKKHTKGDQDTSLHEVSSRNQDLDQLVNYNQRYRKYGEDAEEDRMDFQVVREGYGRNAAQGFEGVLLLATSMEAQDADKDGRLTKAEFVTALRGVPQDAKEERVRKAGKLDKDPEALFELLNVDDSDLVDIGAFVDGVSHALTPRGVAQTKTAQEQSEELARGIPTTEQVQQFFSTRLENAKKDALKTTLVGTSMSKNKHMKEFNEQAGVAAEEANRQATGLKKSVDAGDGAVLASDLGGGIMREAGKLVEVATPQVDIPESLTPGVLKDIKTEYTEFQRVRQEALKEADDQREQSRLERAAAGPSKTKRRTFKVKVNDEVYEMTGSSRDFYEGVDKVMRAMEVDHKTAAQALAEADGDVKAAIADLKEGANEMQLEMIQKANNQALKDRVKVAKKE